MILPVNANGLYKDVPMTGNELMTQIDTLIARREYAAAAPLIKTVCSHGVPLGGRHITYAHALILAVEWTLVNELVPQGINGLDSSGWLRSLAAAVPVNQSGDAIPWFTYSSIDFLQTILKGEWRVFEWGCGNSTRWWAARVQSVLSVEDNPAWHAKIAGQLPANARVCLHGEKTGYIDAVRGERHYDAIVVDGKFRNECLAAAIEHITDSGIIILDNSDDIAWEPGIEAMRLAGFFRIDFWGAIPSYLNKCCTSVFFKDVTLFSNSPAPCRHASCIGASCLQVLQKKSPG
jgi:hypothetical protein